MSKDTIDTIKINNEAGGSSITDSHFREEMYFLLENKKRLAALKAGGASCCGTHPFQTKAKSNTQD